MQRLCGDTSPLNSWNIVDLTQFIGHDPDEKVWTNYRL